MTLNDTQQRILQILANGPQARSHIANNFRPPLSKTTVIRNLKQLVAGGTIIQQGDGQNRVYVLSTTPSSTVPSGTTTGTTSNQPAAQPSLLSRVMGDSAQTKPGDAPPLVDLKVNNPVNSLIHWWKRVISNEGMTVKLKPLTTIGVSIVILGFLTGTFSLATIWWVLNKTPLRNTPLIQYLPTPIPTINPWRQTAFTGTLRSSSGGSAFLITQEREGIVLELPSNVDLQYYINRRIMAIGLYNEFTHTMRIATARDLEFLPDAAEVVPTTAPTPTPSPSPSPSPTPPPAGGPTASPDQPACTMEAKLCPDGSAVGRTGPDCTFAPCPGQ